MWNNNGLLRLIADNSFLIVVIVLFLIRIVPAEWAGFWKYNNNKEADGKAPKITILKLLFQNLMDSVWGTVIINGVAAFQFNQAIMFIIFIVMGFDIFFRHQISREAITLVCIGIIVLYLEKLIETGKHIKLFGGLLEWERKD